MGLTAVEPSLPCNGPVQRFCRGRVLRTPRAAGLGVVVFAWAGLYMNSYRGTAQAAGADFIIPSVEELLARLDPDDPALAEARTQRDAGRTDAGAAGFIKHFRGRTIHSSLFADWSNKPRNPQYDTSRADQLLDGHYWDGYSVYDAPATGLDWHNSPLSCVTRFPIFGVMRYVIHHRGDPKYVRFVVDHILGYMDAYPITEFVGKNTRQGWTNHTTVAKPSTWRYASSIGHSRFSLRTE